MAFAGPRESRAQLGTAPAQSQVDLRRLGLMPTAGSLPGTGGSSGVLEALASGAVVAGPGVVSTADVGAFGVMFSGPLGLNDQRPGVVTVVNRGTTSIQLAGPEASVAGSWILVIQPGHSRSITVGTGGISWAALGDGDQVELAWVLRHP